MIAIMAVDPGGTTGVAWGEFDDTPGMMVRERVDAALLLESFDVEGDYRQQAVTLAREWTGFAAGGGRTLLVMEDFLLRVGRGSSDRAGLLPVRIAAFLEGLLHGRDVNIRYQQAGHAMGYMTNQRMREWGLWVRGADHQRDARRHLIKALADVVK